MDEVHDESDGVVRYGKVESLYRKKKGMKRSVPIIRLKGNWLVKLGFHEGEYVEIHASNGIIFIKPI